jgi:hypothetical protein
LELKPNLRFSLIEMIGVLALIAIMASLLLPKIYEAINGSRISNTTALGGNPKPEIRNPKEIRRPKSETKQPQGTQRTQRAKIRLCVLCVLCG